MPPRATKSENVRNYKSGWREALKSAWKLYRSDRWAVGGLILLVVIVIVAIVGPLVYTLSPFKVVGPPFVQPGSGQNVSEVFGTDAVGRSVLAGVIDGGAPTLLVGAIAGLVSMTLAVVLGSIAGYFGRWVDAISMRLIEATMVIPVILFSLVVLTLVSPSAIGVAVTIGILTWPATARVARAEVAKFRNLEFVRVARTQGCRVSRILWLEILPNILPPLIVMTTLVVAIAMLFQAGLSYLGVTNPNQMTWGLMIGQNSTNILTAWWPVTFPGICVSLTVLSVNLVGGGLNRVLNPHERTVNDTSEVGSSELFGSK